MLYNIFEVRIKYEVDKDKQWVNIKPFETLTNDTRLYYQDIDAIIDVCTKLCQQTTDIIEIRINRLGSLQGFYVRADSCFNVDRPSDEDKELTKEHKERLTNELIIWRSSLGYLD